MNTRNYSILITISIFFIGGLFSCSVTSTMYLQSVSGYTEDKTYGYTESNPILLKSSAKYGYSEVIDEYISRISSYNILPAGYYPDNDTIVYQEERYDQSQTFTITSKRMVTENGKELDISSIVSAKVHQSSIYIYNIISEKGNIKHQLYFRLTPRKENFYCPFALFYGMICG